MGDDSWARDVLGKRFDTIARPELPPRPARKPRKVAAVPEPAPTPVSEPARAPLVDQAGLAAYLGVTVRTVYKLRKQGCPAIKIGRVYRFDAADVLAWLKERTETGQ